MTFVALLATVAILIAVPSLLLSWQLYKDGHTADAAGPGAVGALALTAATLIIAAPWIFRFVVWAMQITP